MNALVLGVGVFLLAAAGGPVRAMRVDPQQTSPPTTAAAEVTPCAQAQMMVDRLLATAMTRLEAARQANAAADLRAAVDSVQTTVRDARAQLAPCASMQPAGAPAGHVMPAPTGATAAPIMAPESPMDHSTMQMGSSPAAKPAKGAKADAPTAPMDHSKMPMGTRPDASAQAVDPVCGLKVDPATAPRATHQGQTYSFCSEQHRQLFQKNPVKFLPKGR